MIDELLVEAAGVELFSVLITRKLLIPGTATTAKKAPLPDPLYVYCTKQGSSFPQVASHNRKQVCHSFCSSRENTPARRSLLIGEPTAALSWHGQDDTAWNERASKEPGEIRQSLLCGGVVQPG